MEFAKDEPNSKLIKIISQALFEAQSGADMGLTSASVLYFDIACGKIHKGARAGSRILGEMEAACKNIVALWDSL